MRFWLCASLVLAAALSSSAAPTQRQTPTKGSGHGANELLLAGRGPGGGTLAIAQRGVETEELAEKAKGGIPRGGESWFRRADARGHGPTTGRTHCATT